MRALTTARTLLALLMLCAIPAQAAAPPAVSHEIVTLTTADGVQLPSVLSYGAGALNTEGPVILYLPDGPGGGPIKADDPARYVADGLARRGLPGLSVETRHTSRYAFSQFDEAVTDVRAAMDMLTGRGFRDIVLAGTGLGSLLAARYAVETGDHRIKAVIHFAPSPDLAQSWRAKAGEEIYWRTVDEASKAVTEGGRGRFINLGDGLIYTPSGFLDWYGPTAKTSLTANMAGVDKPMFLVAGERDPAVPKGRLEQLKAIAFLSRRVDVKYYPGVGHDFAGASDQLIADTAAWLGAQGLGPRPRVATEIVAARTTEGKSLAGVIYLPERPLAGQPAILISHGWAGDVMRSTVHWLGVHLAQRGYVALAFQHRSSAFRGTVSGKLEDTVPDIRSWVDFMATRGHKSIIGVGHAVGGLWLTNYLSATKDARIRGIVLLSPSRDMPRHARLAMGEDLYARTVLAAQEAVRDGKGATELIDAPFPQATYDEDPRQPMYLSAPGSGFTYYYADSFLSYWGPTSRAVQSQRIAEIGVPVLALGGSRDPAMQGAWLISVSEAAAKGEYIFYGGPNGASYSFEGFETRVSDDIVNWLDKTL